MQKWEYAMVQAKWHDKAEERVFFVRYITAAGQRLEQPAGKKVKPKFGKECVEGLNNAECSEWLYSKIAELGQDGWEMVTAPSMTIAGCGTGYSWNDRWLFWFKRPVA